MGRIFYRSLFGAGIGVGLLVVAAPADDSCRSGAYPPVAPWARPTNTPAYEGYYLGGGTAVLGEPRLLTEGTWGWEYEGCLPRRIWLRWTHSRRYQGGQGAYRTDGPEPFQRPKSKCE